MEGRRAAVTTYVFRTTRPSSPREVQDGAAVEGRSAAVTTRHRVQSNVHARAEHATHQWAVVGSGLRNRAISTDCVNEERNKKKRLCLSPCPPALVRLSVADSEGNRAEPLGDIMYSFALLVMLASAKS